MSNFNKKILNQLQSLPRITGVYYFYDKYGNLLYIGKAASLRTRVWSYFRLKPPLPPFKKGGLNTPLTPRHLTGQSPLKRGNDKTDALVGKIADIKYKET
ncbi:MAG: hypothetical protein V1860_01685, partial [bacterium]